MIRDVRIRILIFFTHPGSRGQKGTGSRIWIRNNNFQAGPSHGKFGRNNQKPNTVGLTIFNKIYSFMSWKQRVDWHDKKCFPAANNVNDVTNKSNLCMTLPSRRRWGDCSAPWSAVGASGRSPGAQTSPGTGPRYTHAGPSSLPPALG